MKRFFLLIIMGVSLSIQYAMGANLDNTSERKMTFGAEKDKQIIEVAKKICADHAPDLDISGLIPVIYNFTMDKRYSPFGERDVVSVKFMKDVNDISQQVMYDPSDPKTIILRRRAKAVIHAEVLPDTMEPAGIGDYYGALFIPNYRDFCNENPGFKFKRDKATDEIKNMRSVNETAKEELEKQGYKVTFGKQYRNVEEITAEEWEQRGYKVILQ